MPSIRTALSLTFGLFGLVFAIQPVFADADGERVAMARIVHELESLEPLFHKAETQVEPDARIRFRYDWFRQDLLTVKQGTQAHIDAPRNEPRRFPPLRGDYRR